ncbi:MAG TPA: glycosyltransferase [Solirubrobacteraceae bacterium]
MTVALRAPAAVRAVELTGAGSDVDLARAGEPYRTALLVATENGRPLAAVAVDTEGAAVFDASLARAVLRSAAPGEVPPQGVVAERTDGGHPRVSVVVTTCARAEDVADTVASVLACDPAPLEVVVVENRPGGSRVAAALADRFGGDPRVRCVPEQRRGLSWARNAGLAAARGELVAFTDDDVRVDAGWIGWIERAFDSEPGAACVTGLIMPAELETPAQVLLEQYAGFGKGFARRVHRPDAPTGPLFPYAAGEFGSGANTAMRTGIARALGGFDAALGAGTPAHGAEDLDLYVRVLLAGHAIVYEPAALLWHTHPDTSPRLRSEVFRYGVSLTAMMTKLALHGHAGAIARRALAALRFLRDPASRKNERKRADYPRALDRWEYLGMLCGPLAYLHSRVVTRRLERA